MPQHMYKNKPVDENKRGPNLGYWPYWYGYNFANWNVKKQDINQDSSHEEWDYGMGARDVGMGAGGGGMGDGSGLWGGGMGAGGGGMGAGGGGMGTGGGGMGAGGGGMGAGGGGMGAGGGGMGAGGGGMGDGSGLWGGGMGAGGGGMGAGGGGMGDGGGLWGGGMGAGSGLWGAGKFSLLASDDNIVGGANLVNCDVQHAANRICSPNLGPKCELGPPADIYNAWLEQLEQQTKCCDKCSSLLHR
ncbi:acanthoscurrin-1-like [Cydia amplana]|uniref:acanthoscurrin-1-like n=1 Tax=Cydia amplana TaxID=1869771 RepID=UPI002FE635E5